METRRGIMSKPSTPVSNSSPMRKARKLASETPPPGQGQGSLAGPGGDAILKNEGIEDDVLSLDASQLEESTKMSDTSSVCSARGPKRSKGRGKFGIPKMQYKCINHIHEDHGKPIFGLAVNHFLKPPAPLLFATVGSNRISIYELTEDNKVVFKQAYTDPEEKENFYTCAWSYDNVTGQPILAAAGERGLVRVLHLATADSAKYYIGHGHSINELRTHPKDPNLLLSISKDNTMRLWNLVTDQCVLRFGGVDGHRDEVLSADFNLSADRIVSCGMDHALKIWRLDTPEIQEAVQASYLYDAEKATRPFPTVLQHFPEYSTRDVHRNYIDCVRWIGDFVLSKSCENCIVCWKPGKLQDTLADLKATDATVSVLHRFDFRDCDIWFVRFGLDPQQKTLACGNQYGRVYVWDLSSDDPHTFRQVVLSHSKCLTAVRQVCFSADGSLLLAACDDGSAWLWQRLDRGTSRS